MHKARACLAAAFMIVAFSGVCRAADNLNPEIKPYGVGQLPFDVDLDMVMTVAAANGQTLVDGTTADPNEDASEAHIHFDLQMSRRFGDPGNPKDDSVIGKAWIVFGQGGGLDQQIINPGPPVVTGRIVNTTFGVDQNNFRFGSQNLALVEGHFTLKFAPEFEIRFGLFDPTYYGFDDNRYANNPKTQFAAPALVNNPIVKYNSASLIFNDSFGAAFWARFGDKDRFDKKEAESRFAFGFLFQDGTQVVTAGSPTADLQDVVMDPLVMAQLNMKWKPFGSQVGIIRLYTYYNARTESAVTPVNNTGLWGGGISIDQDLTSTFHGFFRWGTNDEKRSLVAQHVSGGFQWDNPLMDWTGKYQKLGVGVAYEIFSDTRALALNNETQFEMYYWIHIKAFSDRKWKADLAFTPSFQYINNAAGTDGSVMVFSLRSYLKF
ncbi:MAG TPA: hypothetical protein VL860_14780 [Planctomycetota bacterium]|nr:hypothetical protein [Planctomycetota bacterium]